MPSINKFNIQNFRNIKTVDLLLNENYNIFFGSNGAGKTAILEAICLLATGKSFRSYLKSRMITYGCHETTIFIMMNKTKDQYHHKIGLTKTINSKAKLRIDGQYSRSLAAATKLLPIVLVDPNSYELIERGPQKRRHYLDWGLFHVEPAFNTFYSDFKSCLRQRNAAIKAQASKKICQTWDRELIIAAEKITKMRKDYFQKIKPQFEKILAELHFNISIESDYYQGWNEKLNLQEQLNNNLAKDITLGYTSVGPQKADVFYLVNKMPANEVLSRGQMKLMVSTMQFAQGKLYTELTGNRCIYLIDDLASELDYANRNKLFKLLESLQGQCFITATDKNVFSHLDSRKTSLFHVEQGKIIPL